VQNSRRGRNIRRQRKQIEGEKKENLKPNSYFKFGMLI